jgi:hypothetical protein
MTKDAVIGIEAKRYESFRGEKEVVFSDAYLRPVYGSLHRDVWVNARLAPPYPCDRPAHPETPAVARMSKPILSRDPSVPGDHEFVKSDRRQKNTFAADG